MPWSRRLVSQIINFIRRLKFPESDLGVLSDGDELIHSRPEPLAADIIVIILTVFASDDTPISIRSPIPSLCGCNVLFRDRHEGQVRNPATVTFAKGDQGVVCNGEDFHQVILSSTHHKPPIL